MEDIIHHRRLGQGVDRDRDEDQDTDKDQDQDQDMEDYRHDIFYTHKDRVYIQVHDYHDYQDIRV